MSLAAQSVCRTDTNGFTETVKFKVLHCGNVDGNNNKFFCIELQKNPSNDQYRIFTQYGRLGNAGVCDIRLGSFAECDKEYESIVKKKLKGKTIKEDDGTKRNECYVEVDVIAPTIGSPNISQAAGSPKSATRTQHNDFANTFDSSDFEPQVKTLLKQLLAENIHNITSLSSVKMTANGLESELGPLTLSHIEKAYQVLMDLKAIGTLQANDPTVRGLNTKYYSMIPHKFGRRITDADLILDDNKLFQEFDLLDGMKSAITVSNANDDTDTKKIDLGFELSQITDQDLFKELYNKVETTKKHGNLNRWRTIKAYEVKNKKDQDRYKSLPPENLFFHGSRNANILSIVMNSFNIFPANNPLVVGRAFGNGIYGASASTKSLNYSLGNWSGMRNKFPNAFLFVVEFGMGRVYECYDSQPHGPPKGYDSIHAREGRYLQNDEFIVYNLSQARLRYLLELEQR